jgi:hypothetical protein
MRTCVAAKVPNDMVARMDALGPRSAVIVAVLRAYLRRKPAQDLGALQVILSVLRSTLKL